MSQDYRSMWSELGLDLAAHDSLLEVLGSTYQEIFLSQKNRPKGMEYFDFVMSEVHGLRIKELMDAKAKGRKVIGSFCVFVPEEIILALDSVSVGLCAGAEFGFEKTENLLPSTTCSLIKSAFGFKLSKVCPYIEVCDMVVGENTCDGKKKSYEILDNYVDNLHIIDMPQMKSEAGKALLKAEYLKFIDVLEQLTDKSISIDNLRHGIEIVNNKRKAMMRLAELRSVNSVPISGLDALLANQVSFFDDPIRFTDSLNKICDELEERTKTKKGVNDEKMPRIIISGCPMAVPNWKIPWVVETSNAVVVGEESCVGERSMRWFTSEAGNSVETLLDNIVERYFKIDCAVFTPNPSRLQHVKEMVGKYKANGVIHYNLQFCQPYQIESRLIKNELEKENIPVLILDTDYSMGDVGQIRTRIEAFIELLKNNNRK